MKVPLLIPAAPNEVWSADFMADALWSGRRFRTFNVLEDFNREALPIEIDTNLPAQLQAWARRHGVQIRFIQPRRPMQNGFVERFNRTYRQEVLDCYVFETLAEVRRMTAE